MADDDVTVEVEDEGYQYAEGAQPREVIINENPGFLLNTYSNVCTFFASYGWPTLFMVILVIVMWSNFERKVRNWLEKKHDEHSAVNSDPDLLVRRAEAMERARQKMQEKASAIIKKEAERRKELEEIKRQERLEDYDALQHGKSSHATQRKLGRSNDSAKDGPSSSNKSKPRAQPLHSGFNPLSGSSSSARYRPAPRRTGGG